MTFLEDLEAGRAKTLAGLARGSSTLGRILQREGVPNTPELARVLALPRRVWETDDRTERLVQLLTKELRASGGTRTLYSHQAILLAEAYEKGGAVGGLKVGTGKSDLAFVAPTVLRAKRPVLLVPSKLRGKTARHFEELARHWKRPPSYTVIGYQELGIARNEKLLDNAAPDLIVADEAHKILNLDAAVTRRVERYLRDHPGTKLIVMSGTMVEEHDLVEYHHLLRWCLVEGMPLPGSIGEAIVWSRAIDDVPLSARMAPGALVALFNDEERGQAEQGADERELAKAAYERRLRETPGVVVTRDIDVSASLQIEVITERPRLPKAVREAIDQAWAGVKPSGVAIEEGDEAHYVGELSLGFCYEPDHPAPQPWLDRRRKYKQIERMILDQRRPGLDSPDQVKAALARGEFGRVEAFIKWRVMEDLYQPVMIPRWISYDIVDEIAEIARTLGDDVVIWTHYWAPGDAMRDRHGFRFFRHDGADAKGPIEDARGIIVASIDGCGEGHNLQHRYATNLVMTPVGESGAWEQFIGRTHRAGQKADTVMVYALGHTSLYKGILGRLRENAKGTSRLAIADWV